VQDIDQYPKVFLPTGDCFLAVRPTLVSTVLGSCVAVTMCDPASGLMGGAGRTNHYDIGGRNLSAVRQWLLGHGLPISKSQTGGVQGRKLHFLTHTGDVWVKLLNRSDWDR